MLLNMRGIQLKERLEGVKRRLLSRIGGETMNKTPTREIMEEEIVYMNREELPPDAGSVVPFLFLTLQICLI